MNKTRTYLASFLLIIGLWSSLVIILIIVEKIILKLKIGSAGRSVLGMALYFSWLLIWYFMFRHIASLMLTKTKSPK
mgnify:CR=1 FL=1